jgi:hypothetical protein
MLMSQILVSLMLVFQLLKHRRVFPWDVLSFSGTNLNHPHLINLLPLHLRSKSVAPMTLCH